MSEKTPYHHYPKEFFDRLSFVLAAETVLPTDILDLTKETVAAFKNDLKIRTHPKLTFVDLMEEHKKRVSPYLGADFKKNPKANLYLQQIRAQTARKAYFKSHLSLINAIDAGTNTGRWVSFYAITFARLAKNNRYDQGYHYFNPQVAAATLMHTDPQNLDYMHDRIGWIGKNLHDLKERQMTIFAPHSKDYGYIDQEAWKNLGIDLNHSGCPAKQTGARNLEKAHQSYNFPDQISFPQLHTPFFTAFKNIYHATNLLVEVLAQELNESELRGLHPQDSQLLTATHPCLNHYKKRGFEFQSLIKT